MSTVLLGSLDAEEIACWHRALRASLPADEVLHRSDEPHDAVDVDIALVANPPPGALERYPNLRFVQSLWAGVERLLADPDLPATLTIARLVDPDLTQAMVEAVVAHVTTLHRQAPEYAQQQRRGEWKQLPQPLARERRVGVLGTGQLGAAVASTLSSLGFTVAGWSRSPRALDGVQGFTGEDGLDLLVRRTDILVNLLPLTPATTGLLDRRLFARLPRGAGLVNVARGKHLVEGDLLDALDSRQVGHAILDVFPEEPLPPGHAFWQHPHMTILPHVAAYTDPVSAAKIAAANVRAFRTGAPLTGSVERARGY